VFNKEYLKTKVDKMMHSESLVEDKAVLHSNSSGVHLEIEKKYLVTKSQVEMVEKKCLEISLSLISHQYEKNQNFDRDGIFENDDARLRLRTKIKDLNSHVKNFEFTYKKRLGIENGIKKETELNYNFTSDQPSENLLAIFTLTGLTERDSYERTRKTFTNKDVQLTIDEFPFGYIAELEGDEDKVLEYEKLLSMEGMLQYGKSCDDVYMELCQKKGVEPKNRILFEDTDMPKLDEYIKTWKK
jgi:adenylate cyclase class IV